MLHVMVSALALTACTRAGFERSGAAPDARIIDGPPSPSDGSAGDASADSAAPSDTALGQLTVEPLFPQYGADFFHYVARDPGKRVAQQADAACALSPWTYYHTCLHGGELRKVVVSGESDCQGLSLRDALDVFRWVCVNSASGVFFHSVGFKEGKGLRDLLRPDAFEANKVTLEREGVLIAESPLSAEWWNNTVTPLTLNSGAADAALSLDTSGTIYTVATSGASRGLVIKASGVGLVVLPGAVLTDASALAPDCDPSSRGAQPCLIYGETGDYVWIEGAISTSSNSRTIVQGRWSANETRRWRYHNLRISASGLNANGLYLESGDAALVTQSEIHSAHVAVNIRSPKNIAFDRVNISSEGPTTVVLGVNAWYTFFNECQILKGSVQAVDAAAWYVTFANSRISNSAGIGISAPSSRNTTLINSILSNNEAQGASLHSNGTFVMNVTTANNRGAGLLIGDWGTPSLEVEGLVSVNNVVGLEIQLGGGTLSNLYLGNNGAGIVINGAATDNVFTNNLYLGANGVDCTISSSGASPGLTTIGTLCALEGGSDAAISTGITGNDFFPRLVSSDLVNAHSMATAPGASVITDWFRFENRHRAWGRDAAYPASAARGACRATEPCRIWDWTLLAGGAPLYDAHGSFSADAPCPSSVQGDKTFRYADPAGADAYALRHAIEILGDLFGNENGFCDSGEACIFAPHLGAYQGAGTPRGPCLFANGVGARGVVDVLLYAR